MIENKLTQFLHRSGINVRPNAGNGIWLMFLLPLSLVITAIKHPVILTPAYKLSVGLAVGFTCTSLVLLYQSLRFKKPTIIDSYLLSAGVLTSLLFWSTLHKNVAISIFSGFTATICYQKTYFFILKNFPFSFTFGEAAVAGQGLVLLTYSLLLNVSENTHKIPTNNLQMSTITIQIGLAGIGAIAYLAWKLNLKSAVKFYTLGSLVIFFIILLPLHILMQRSPLLWIINLMISDLSSIKLLLSWCTLSVFAVLAINSQVKKEEKASTGTRKIFHFLIIAVYIPGLLYNCSILYLSSGVILGIFFTLEIVRVLKIPPLSEHLQNGFTMFVDTKDSGVVALTPIYLLVGCSLPLWLHPAPCDVTNSAVFNFFPLLSGVLTVGVGDSSASIVGSHFGRHHWLGKEKSIEGTLACVLSQLLAILFLVQTEILKLPSIGENIKAVLAVVVTSLIEAQTDQVDNLVLPLVMYIIVI